MSPQAQPVGICPTPITKEKVRDLFGLMNKALQTRDLQNVADLYMRNAVLLPTLSNRAHAMTLMASLSTCSLS